MNRRGIFVVEIIFANLFFLGVVSAIIGRPAHIVKRATEKCVSLGELSDICKSWVSSISEAERIEYIRDR